MIKKIIFILAILGPFIAYFFYTQFTRLSKKKFPIKMLSLVSVILVITSLGYLRLNENYSPSLTKPNTSLEPFDIIAIQLNALQRNNVPFNDAGIEQVWEFAHPNNKKITGPLKRFKKMIYSKNYKMLVEHKNSEIIILSENLNKSVYKVIILSNDKKKYSYIWQVEKVEDVGDLMNCWMTTSVSNPEYLGETV